jgi:hypothetical protein
MYPVDFESSIVKTQYCAIYQIHLNLPNLLPLEDFALLTVWSSLSKICLSGAAPSTDGRYKTSVAVAAIISSQMRCDNWRPYADSIVAF